MKKKTGKFIGIDLGTTFSSMSHMTASGAIEIIPNADGDPKTPSVVSTSSGKSVVGKAALPDLYLDPEHVERCTKRYMGEATAEGKPVPISADPSGQVRTPVDTAADILGNLKADAERYLGETVDRAVITVPAYFDEVARENTKAAGFIAGYKSVELLDEPVAAALSYGLEKQKEGILIVIDFGGGTLDVTALEIEDNNIRVIEKFGDNELGGSNYNELILAYKIQEAKSAGIKISAETDLPSFCQNYDRACEGKEMLSRREEVTLIAEAGGKRKPIKFTRQMLRKVCKSLDDRLRGCCEKLRDKLQSQGKKPDSIVQVGGGSRLFQAPEIVKEVFSLEPSMDTDLDLAVAKGAAIWAAICFGDADQQIILGSRCLPAGEIKVQNITAHAICVAAQKSGGTDGKEYNCEIVRGGSSLPYTIEEYFSPVRSDQTSVLVKLVQGVPDELSENSTLLRKINVPIKPTNHDENRIKVSGCYNAEGILEITVIDKILGKPVTDSFTYQAGLTQAEIDEKRKQFEENK